MADSAVARLRGILAANMTRADIEQLLSQVTVELLHTAGEDYVQAIRAQAVAAIGADKPLWTDASTYAYHARLCLVCGYESSHWTEQSPAAAQMEQHLTEHRAVADA